MLRPFKTEPLLVPKVWGGRLLHDRFGKRLPDERPYGESWEVADLENGQSLVATGPHRGDTLREMVERYGVDLVGAGFETFPLLVKILDAATDLSVQVHPGKEDLSRHPGADLKDESWIILSADGPIYHGVVPGIDAEKFQQSFESGDVMEKLRRIEPEVGDAIRVAPGTMHAIGGGIALLEIQTPSDTTFRVWDHGRVGMDGLPRTLHVDQAMDVARFENSESLRHEWTSIETELYTIERLQGACSVSADGHAKVVINVGTDRFDFAGLDVAAFESVIIPACFEEAIAFNGDAIVSWARPH